MGAIPPPPVGGRRALRHPLLPVAQPLDAGGHLRPLLVQQAEVEGEELEVGDAAGGGAACVTSNETGSMTASPQACDIACPSPRMANASCMAHLRYERAGSAAPGAGVT